MTTLTKQVETSSRRAISSILIGCAMMFVILEFGVTFLAALLDQTWAALIVTAIVVLVAVLFERQAFKHDGIQGLQAVGYARPNPRAVWVAAIIGLIMLAFFPLFSMITGAQITLKADWLWILVGIIALNGIGEETLFRGYVFGGLRREAGLSFRQAGFISMAIFAAVHLLLFIGNPFFVGFLGTLVAVSAAFPMAILFERGNNTIWAPVVLHVATHTIRLVDISEPQYLTAVGIWLLLQIGMVFLVYLFLNNLLKHKLKNEAKNMQLVSVNLGQERMLKNKHRIERTGIFKFPVEGPVKVAKLGLEGDIIISKKHHGGPDQAVYVYGDADYAWWAGELNKEIFPGTFGDNLTISELESAQFNIGDTIHFSDVILQVTAPRIPCATFAARMEDPQWVKRFRHAERPGLYCRVIKEGFIKADDRVSIEKYTGETISITEMFHDYYDRNKSEEMLRRQLNAPIAIRARRDMEKELQKLLAQS